MADTLDMVNRDPNSLNAHIQVAFEDVLAEPDGAHSIDCIWRNSFRCFECGKNICYKLSTLCCGLCIALFWGCEFACLAFDHVWCWTPCVREFSITAGCFRKVYSTIVDCCCGPVCATFGLCLSNIKIAKG